VGAAFLVPAALTALSAAGNYVNQNQAQSRQNTDEVEALADQQKLRDQANGQVRALTNQVATDSPAKIAAQSTGDYVAALRRNAAGSTQGGSTTGGTQTFGASSSALPPNSVAGANSRYGADLASGQSEVQNFGNTYAGEMGQIDAATRMRQNEGLAAQTLGTNLNTIGQASYGQNFVDQLRAQAAGQQNPWLAMASSLFGGAGNAISKNPTAYFGQPKIQTSVAPSVYAGGYDPATQPLGDLANA
jgi:hypothetical protein